MNVSFLGVIAKEIRDPTNDFGCGQLRDIACD